MKTNLGQLWLLLVLFVIVSVQCLEFSEQFENFDKDNWFEILGKTKSAWGKHSVFADWLVKEKETADLVVDMGIDYGKYIHIYIYCF